MSTDSTKGPEATPATSSAPKPQPKDGMEELENGLELVKDLLTGKRTPRDVVGELLDAVFGPSEKKDETAPKTSLRAVK